MANAFQGSENTVDFASLPWVIFTDPQVVGVGMDERAAKEKDLPFEVTSLPLSEVPRSVAALDTRGFIKLIRNPETDLLLGARIVAPEGSELAMEISLAIKYKIPVKDLIATLHPYLTLLYQNFGQLYHLQKSGINFFIYLIHNFFAPVAEDTL